MVNVGTVQRSHDSCTKYLYYNVEGSESPRYCKQHAEADIVKACRECCSHNSCVKHPTFAVVAGSITAVFCSNMLETAW